MRHWLKHWLWRIKYFIWPGSCQFCKRRSLGVYAHGGMPISFSVCKDHAFLLGCGPDTLNRAMTWKNVGYNYTEEYHRQYKEKQWKDQLEANAEFDKKAAELNPQPVIHTSSEEWRKKSPSRSSYL